MKYPLYVMQAVRQNLGLKPDDTSEDITIENMPKSEVFNRLATWNNLPGYGATITRWVQDVYGVNLDESKSTLAVHTERGVITATAKNGEDDPSIDVQVGDNLAAVVEYDSHNEAFRIHNYRVGREEPIFSAEFPLESDADGSV